MIKELVESEQGVKAIYQYNLRTTVEKRSTQKSYHQAGGGGNNWFENHFVNLDIGQKWGPFISDKELIITCCMGAFELLSDNDDLFVYDAVRTPGDAQRNIKSTKLSELDQAVIDPGCALTVVCTAKGTIQILGTPKAAIKSP